MSKIEDALRYVKLYTNCDDFALKRIRSILENNFKQKERVQIIEKKSVFYVKIKDEAPTISISEFADNFCQENDIEFKDLKKKVRFRETILLRDKFIFEAIVNGYSYTEVGRILGKHHSTIIHSFKKSKK